MRSNMIGTADHIPSTGARHSLCAGSGWKYILTKFLKIEHAVGKLPSVGNGTAGLQLRSLCLFLSSTMSNWVHRAFFGGKALR